MAFEERLADEARFLKTWFENPLGTGAVSPSGRSLARAMARCVDPNVAGPVIELGPGTGPVTEALIRRGIAPERLILVEFDPTFCKLLARRYPGAKIVKGDAYRLSETLQGRMEAPAAAVVSSLPLLTRPDSARLDLLAQAFALLQPGAAFVQFTYGIVSPMPRRRPCALHFDAQASKPVWLNIPPARVWVYRAAAETAPAAAQNSAPAAEAVLREHGFRLKLKSGTELLREELRDGGGKLRRHLGSKAAKAREELRASAERVKSGFKRKAEAARTDGWEGVDLLGQKLKGGRRR